MNEPDFNSLQSPEISSAIGENIEIGLNKIVKEVILKNDSPSDGTIESMSLEDIKEFISGFYIMLNFFLSSEDNEDILYELVDDLFKLCKKLNNYDKTEITKVIEDLKG